MKKQKKKDLGVVFFVFVFIIELFKGLLKPPKKGRW